MLGRFLWQNGKRKDRFDNRKKYQITFYWKKCWKKELKNCESKWEDTTDNKIQNVFFFFSRIGRKRKTEKNTVDFYNTKGQQSFLYNSINWIEIKIENDTVKNMIEKYKKNQAKFTLEGLLFSSSVQNDTEKIFITTAGLLDAKFSLIHGKIHQAIGVINLNEIDDWETI